MQRLEPVVPEAGDAVGGDEAGGVGIEGVQHDGPPTFCLTSSFLIRSVPAEVS
jgi:hypothetical protein